jgi:3-hydroxyisobutyrate dehydrogenase-like beta-hydroxyacid dehydrogenase
MGTTRFYASGPDVKIFEALTDYGLDIRPIGANIGQAKGIKMAYGALTKGLAAISTQLLIAAWKMGLYNDLIEDFMKSQAELYKWMERRVPRMPNRSRRWIGEMEEISKTFNALGLTSKIYEGAADTYRFVGRTTLAEETAKTVDLDRSLEQVIERLANEM